MPRPPFALTDDQARMITLRVANLQATFPLDPRNHRPFLRGFMRAVHEATGKFYSPAIYRRLLAAFAPERRPSTATLELEKQTLLAMAPEPTVVGAPTDNPINPGVDANQLLLLVSDAVSAAIARSGNFGATNGSQLAFYEARLRESELALLAVRAEAARLAGELAVARQAVTMHEQECEKARTSLDIQSASVAKLTAEVSDMRRFALQSIEEARGESRAWKERCAALEAQRQADARLLETFRQHAYRLGAAIPDILKQEKPR